jgi:hypothetical protein
MVFLSLGIWLWGGFCGGRNVLSGGIIILGLILCVQIV